MLLFKGTTDLKLHVILYSQRNLIVNQETDNLYQMARMIFLFFGNMASGVFVNLVTVSILYVCKIIVSTNHKFLLTLTLITAEHNPNF